MPGTLASASWSHSRKMKLNARTSRMGIGASPVSRDRVAELLARYPGISKNENREILEFMRTGRHLDIGLLTSNQELAPNLDAFMDEHRRHFRVSIREATAVIFLIAAFLFASWLFWELVVSRPL